MWALGASGRIPGQGLHSTVLAVLRSQSNEPILGPAMLFAKLLLPLASFAPDAPQPVPAVAAASAHDAPVAAEPGSQDDKATVRAWLKILRDKRASEADRDDAFEELLTLGSEGPLALTQHYEKEAERAAKSNEKALKKFLKSFDKDARGIIEDRIDRDAEDAIEAHRATIRRNAVDQSLTKERIEAESDPAFEALEELLTIEAEAVLAADEDLAADHAEIAAAAEEEALLHERFERAMEALGKADSGAAGKVDPLDPPVLSPKGLEALLAERADLARPMKKSDERVFETNAERAPEIDPKEAEGIRFLNLRLVLLGLPAQEIDVKLCAACRDHSKDMKEIGFFSHESPVEGKEHFSKRASNFGTSASSENISKGRNDAEGAIMGWWYSPGHHRNMLGGKARVGLGYHESHWTQNFD